VNCDSWNVINCPRRVSPVTLCHSVFTLLHPRLISLFLRITLYGHVPEDSSFVPTQKANLQTRFLGRCNYSTPRIQRVVSTGAGHTDPSVIGALLLENDGRTSFETNALDEIVTDM
jgi:hypothetical protein